jgi:hypothetical protein
MEERCGGAVERNRKMLLAVNSQSMKKRKRMKKMMKPLTKRKIK